MSKFVFEYPQDSHISFTKIVEVSRPGGDKFYVEGCCDSDDVVDLPGEYEGICSGSNMIVSDQSKIVVYSEKNESWGEWGR